MTLKQISAKNGGGVEYSCDGAGCYQGDAFPDCDDFREASAMLRDIGWVGFPHEGRYIHHCDKCKKRYGTE